MPVLGFVPLVVLLGDQKPMLPLVSMNSVDWVRKLALEKYGGSEVAVKFPGTRTPLILAEVVAGSQVGEPAFFHPV
ncbi:MAG: hypothetical protein AABY89_01365, partial [Acidobacteriota bacterium]